MSRLGGPDPQNRRFCQFSLKMTILEQFSTITFFSGPVVFKYMIFRFLAKKKLTGHVLGHLGRTAFIKKIKTKSCMLDYLVFFDLYKCTNGMILLFSEILIGFGGIGPVGLVRRPYLPGQISGPERLFQQLIHESI